MGEPAQRGLDRFVELGIAGSPAVQLEPGGDPFEKEGALLGWKAAGGRHDRGKLIVIEREHGAAIPRSCTSSNF